MKYIRECVRKGGNFHRGKIIREEEGKTVGRGREIRRRDTGFLAEVVSAMTRTGSRVDRGCTLIEAADADAIVYVVIIPLNVEHDLAPLR